MRSYSLFVGEVVSDKISVSLPPDLRNTLETECREAWKELNRIPSTIKSASPFVPYHELSKSIEGRTHMYLLDKMFYIPTSIPGYPRKPYAKPVTIEELNAAMSRVQAQRYKTQGRRKQVIERAASSVDYRKFRSWWVSKHLAQALGAEFSEPCPFEKYTDGGPTVSYIEIGHHFEKWTGYKIPKELWAELRADEAERLRAKQQAQQELQAA